MKTWETKNGCKIIRVLAGRSNVFLIAHGGKHILVDTSPGSCWRKLQRNLRRLGLERLDALILTHSHYDHAGNAARVHKKYNVPVIMHRAEAPFLAGGENIVPHGTNRLGRLLIDHLGKKFVRSIRCEPCQADILVDETLRLDDYGFNAFILHTPGHSPGSQSVIIDDEIVLVGDAMFGVLPWSVFPPFAGDARQMIESWGKLLATGCRLFLPSHGTANRSELVQKDYDKRKRLEERKTKRVCPVEHAGVLDFNFRKLLQNPRKILQPYIKEGMTVLDLGCGPGFFTMEMARLVGKTGKVIAADLQEGMLAIVRKKIQNSAMADIVKFHLCQPEGTGLSEKFDFILVFYMLHEVPDPLLFLREIQSLLKLQGMVLIIEPKWHVSRNEFLESIAIMQQAGLAVLAEPNIRFSRTIVIGNTGNARS